MHDKGQLEQVGGRWQLRFTRRLPHPPEKVWSALTEPEHRDVWFPNRIEGELKEGATLRHVFSPEHDIEMDGEVLVCEPPSRLEFTWGEDTLRFRLTPDGDGTVLELVDVLVNVGKGARDGAGWHVKLDALQQHLDGHSTNAGDDPAVWRPVYDAYVAEFPPEATTAEIPANSR